MAPSPVLSVFLGMLTGVVVSFGLVASHKKRTRASAGRSRDAAGAALELDAGILSGPLIADDVTQLIGKTPLVRLNRVTEGCEATILAKLESMEPCSSVKDRIGLSLIDAAERRGQITRGVTTLVEPTSGNTGIAMAMVAAVRGYETILVMPDTMSMERRVLLKALGAKLVLTSAKKGFAGVLDKAEAILAKLGDKAFMLSQFSNPDNPKAHRENTGPELWVQTSGEIDAFVAGVGTGGTVTGSAQFLKAVKPSIKVCAVEPVESPVLSGGPPGSHMIQGIAAGIIPDNYDSSLIDQILTVTSEDAIAMAREVALKEGLLVGISAGAAVQAALDLAKQPEMKGKTICVIIPSSGERYLSTVLFAELLEEARNQEVEE